MSYTYVLLEVSPEAYKEIHDKLLGAGYIEQFHGQSDGRIAIDMHGIAVVQPLADEKP